MADNEFSMDVLVDLVVSKGSQSEIDRVFAEASKHFGELLGKNASKEMREAITDQLNYLRKTVGSSQAVIDPKDLASLRKIAADKTYFDQLGDADRKKYAKLFGVLSETQKALEYFTSSLRNMARESGLDIRNELGALTKPVKELADLNNNLNRTISQTSSQIAAQNKRQLAITARQEREAAADQRRIDTARQRATQRVNDTVLSTRLAEGRQALGQAPRTAGQIQSLIQRREATGQPLSGRQIGVLQSSAGTQQRLSGEAEKAALEREKALRDFQFQDIQSKRRAADQDEKNAADRATQLRNFELSSLQKKRKADEDLSKGSAERERQVRDFEYQDIQSRRRAAEQDEKDTADRAKQLRDFEYQALQKKDKADAEREKLQRDFEFQDRQKQAKSTEDVAKARLEAETLERNEIVRQRKAELGTREADPDRARALADIEDAKRTTAARIRSERTLEEAYDEAKKTAGQLATAERNLATTLNNLQAKYAKGAATLSTGSIGTSDRLSAYQANQLATRSAGAYQQYANTGSKLGIDTAAMRGAGDQVRNFGVQAEDARQRVGKLNEGVAGLGSTFRNFGRYALGYGALYEGLNAVRALATSVTDLQAGLKNIQAVAQISDKDMEALSRSILAVGTNSRFSIKELTEATLVLTQAGVAAGDLGSVLKATETFASATGSSLEQAADLITTARTVFKELSDDTIVNQLTKAVNISKLTGQDLQTILSLSAQVATDYKLTSEQYLAAVTTLRNAGIKSSTVATGLRQSLLELFSPDDKLVSVLQARYKEVGEVISKEAVRSRFLSFQSAENPLVAVLTEIKRLGFGAEGQGDFARAFDVRSINAIQAMIGNLEQLRANESRVSFGGAAADAAGVQMEALNNKLIRLGNTLVSVAAKSSKGFLDGFGEVVDSINGAIARLDEFDEKRKAEGKSPLQTSGNVAALAGGGLLGLAGKLVTESLLKPEASPEQAQAQSAQAAQAKDNYEAFRRNSEEFNVAAAEAGKVAGTSAADVAKGVRAAKELKLAQEQLFGGRLPLLVDNISDLTKEYTGLSGIGARKTKATELFDRFPQLQQKFPSLGDPKAEGFSSDFAKFDKQMRDVEAARENLSGSIQGQAEGIKGRLESFADILRKGPGGSKPQEYLQAKIFTDVVNANAELKKVLDGSSQDSKTGQENTIKSAIQEISDKLNVGTSTAYSEYLQKSSSSLLSDLKLVPTDGLNKTAAIRSATDAVFSGVSKIGDDVTKRIDYFTKALEEELARADIDGGYRAAVEAALADLKSRSLGVLQQTAEANKGKQQRADQFGQILGDQTQGQDLRQYIDNPDNSLPKTTVVALQRVVKDGRLQTTDKDFDAIIAGLDEFLNKRAEIAERERRRTALQKSMVDEEEQLESLKNRAAVAAAKNQTDLAEKLNTQAAGLQQSIASRKSKQATEDYLNAKPEDEEQARQKAQEALRNSNRINQQAVQQNARRRQDQQVNEARKEGDTLTRERNNLQKGLNSALSGFDTTAIEAKFREIDAVNEKILTNLQKQNELTGLSKDAQKQSLDAKREELMGDEEMAKRQRQVFDAQQQYIDKYLGQAKQLNAGDSPEAARRRARGGTNKEEELEVVTDNLDRNKEVREISRGRLDDARKRMASIDPKAPGYAEAAEEVDKLTHSIEGYDLAIGDLSRRQEELTSNWKEGFKKSFDVNAIDEALQSSENTIGRYGDVINNQIVGAWDNVGDAIAGAIADGESFEESFKAIVHNLGREMLATLIKTFLNEALHAAAKALFGAVNGGGSGGGGGGGGEFSAGGFFKNWAIGAVGSYFGASAGGGGGYNPEQSAAGGGFGGTQGYVNSGTGSTVDFSNYKFARGAARIEGPGTRTSDSIAARLSRHESVLNANATDLLGVDFINAANSGRVGAFARGMAGDPTHAVRLAKPAADKQNQVAENVGESIKEALGNMEMAPKINVFNNIDSPSVVREGLRDGKVLVNAMRANRQEIKPLFQ